MHTEWPWHAWHHTHYTTAISDNERSYHFILTAHATRPLNSENEKSPSVEPPQNICLDLLMCESRLSQLSFQRITIVNELLLLKTLLHISSGTADLQTGYCPTLAVVVAWKSESCIAAALVRPQCVHAHTIAADVWISGALVNVDTRIAGGRQGETFVANALKAAL